MTTDRGPIFHAAGNVRVPVSSWMPVVPTLPLAPVIDIWPTLSSEALKEYAAPAWSETAVAPRMARRRFSVAVLPPGSETLSGLPLLAARAAPAMTAAAWGDAALPALRITWPLATWPTASRARTRTTMRPGVSGARARTWPPLVPDSAPARPDTCVHW